MIGLTVLLLLAGLGAALAPDTAIGKTLREALIELPARLLNRDRLSLIIAVVAFVGLVTFLAGAPELVALVGLADLSLFVDIAALGLVLGSAVRLKIVRAAVAEISRRLVGRLANIGSPRVRATVRARRLGRSRRARSNDPDPLGGWALAAVR